MKLLNNIKNFLTTLKRTLLMKNETTYMDDVGIHVCNNCGAQAREVKDIKHYDSCKPGESKKWEKYYNEL